MRNEQYDLEIDDASITFEFISEGPKGNIKKRVVYQRIRDTNTYNLAFGDVDTETNKLDDKVVSNNNDTEKVLTTVASTIYTFIKKHPRAIIYAEGSTIVRTRLYRIGISNNLEKLKEQFDVYGRLADIGWVRYEKNNDYLAFFIKKSKKNDKNT